MHPLRRSLIQVQPMPQPVSAIFYMDKEYGRQVRERAARFRAEELALTPAERRLFFGDSVFVAPTESPESAFRSARDAGEVFWTTLWMGLLPDLEARGWALVELLRSGKPRLLGQDNSDPTLLWTRSGWLWVQGELDAERVRRGLSIWGVLEHSRVEERELA